LEREITQEEDEERKMNWES